MIVAKKKLDYYYPEEIKPEEKMPQKKKPQKPNKNNKIKKKKSKAKSKLHIIGLAIIGLVVSLFILRGYANITKTRAEITVLERQKVELAREEDDLLSELERIKSSLKIENDAIIKLGMDFPREEQLVHVSVEDIALDNDINVGDEFILVRQFKNIVNLVSSLF